VHERLAALLDRLGLGLGVLAAALLGAVAVALFVRGPPPLDRILALSNVIIGAPTTNLRQ
jgi:hypothetical protein